MFDKYIAKKYRIKRNCHSCLYRHGCSYDFDEMFTDKITGEHEINFEKLEQLSGNASKSHIVQKAIEVPDVRGIYSNEIKKKVLLNSAIKAVKSTKVTNLALVDVDARYSAITGALLENVNKLIIYLIFYIQFHLEENNF